MPGAGRSSTYLALFRGLNVGGKGIVKMQDLRAALERAGLRDVRTHITSGNAIFSAAEGERASLPGRAASAMAELGLDTVAAIFSAPEWQDVLASTPAWWDGDPEWRYNLIALVEPCRPADVLEAIGPVDPAIERLAAGPGVVYQAILMSAFGRSRGARINRHPVYRQVTIRGARTARELGRLLGPQMLKPASRSASPESSSARNS